MTDYKLTKGSHKTRAEGLCAMEWTAYLAGEDHTDQPQCVSPILRSFCIELNDCWDDDMRQRLRPYLARCIGTAEDGRDEDAESGEPVSCRDAFHSDPVPNPPQQQEPCGECGAPEGLQHRLGCSRRNPQQQDEGQNSPAVRQALAHADKWLADEIRRLQGERDAAMEALREIDNIPTDTLAQHPDWPSKIARKYLSTPTPDSEED